MTEQAVRAESVHDEHAHPSDHWLDEVTAPTGPAFSGLSSRAMEWFAGPTRLLRRFYYFASTTYRCPNLPPPAILTWTSC